MSRKSSRLPKEEIEVSEAHEQEEPEGNEAESLGKPTSKAGAARAALAEGISVPKQASVYIKQKYGIDITPQQFSAEKCRLKQRSGDGDPAPSFSFGQHKFGSSASPEHRTSGGKPDLLEALEVMKPLISRLGAEQVKRMVDLLG